VSLNTPSPRLFVIFASAADEAVIFRRGPSAWYHLLRWDVARDTFDHGAWFRGTIYPEKCDLSPDGRLLVCFVHQGRKSGTSYTDSWTAVSRSPWMAALGLWPQGTTYGGGGRFLGQRHVMLRTAASKPHPNHPARGLQVEFGDAPVHAAGDLIDGAQWAGCDRNGDLAFAKDGRIFRRSAKGQDKLLIDLNGLEPDPRPAPAWALSPA
jgi:hypothetical protein